MIVERALPFNHQLSCTIVDYHQLSFSLSLFKFFMIVDNSFSRLTTRMIVNDSFSVSCFGNHRPYSGQKTCCRPLSSRKIHTFASLSYGKPFCIRIFTWKELGTRCSRDFDCATAGELSWTITNFFLCDWSRKIAPLSNLTRASLLVEWKLTAKVELNCEIYKSWRKCWKNQVSFCHWSSPVSRKVWTLPWKLQELKKYPRKTCGYDQPRDHLIRVLNERSVHDGGDFCLLWMVILKSAWYSVGDTF